MRLTASNSSMAAAHGKRILQCTAYCSVSASSTPAGGLQTLHSDFRQHSWTTQFCQPSSLVMAISVGQTESADRQLRSWMEAWNTFGWLPELFDVGVSVRHPMEKVLAPSVVSCPESRFPSLGIHKMHGVDHTLNDDEQLRSIKASLPLGPPETCCSSNRPVLLLKRLTVVYGSGPRGQAASKKGLHPHTN